RRSARARLRRFWAFEPPPSSPSLSLAYVHRAWRVLRTASKASVSTPPCAGRKGAAMLVTLLLIAAAPPAAAAKTPTPAEVKAFGEKIDAESLPLSGRQPTADWIKNTYITDDTERNAAALDEDLGAFVNAAVKESAKYRDVKGLDPDTQRMLTLLKFAQA